MPFKKGQSGNPGGRMKDGNDVQRLAKTYSREAIDRLAYWMRKDDAKASVPSSNAILDRAWGKPAQAITGADGGALEVRVVKFDG